LEIVEGKTTAEILRFAQDDSPFDSFTRSWGEGCSSAL
jgi:hypothetical protein